MNVQDQAKVLFDAHYNCAQSVFGSFAEHFGLDQETAFKIATPFGGGIAHSGHICGAVSGAIMAIGLARGIVVYDQTEKYACYDQASEFMERFIARHGCLTCPGLLGLDIGDPIELEQARALDLFHTRCPEFVGDAAGMVAELLNLAV